jgi:hypothetical protein
VNNVEAIDYTISDWIDDNDVCISRRSSEFPRLTHKFTHHFSSQKPWGHISDPVRLDFLQSDNPLEVKPGIWYYGGIEGVDHLDMCGFPEHLTPLRTLLGIEFRYELWRRLFIRLKQL